VLQPDDSCRSIRAFPISVSIISELALAASCLTISVSLSLNADWSRAGAAFQDKMSVQSTSTCAATCFNSAAPQLSVTGLCPRVSDW